MEMRILNLQAQVQEVIQGFKNMSVFCTRMGTAHERTLLLLLSVF